jgi:hypothetical protein
MAGNSKHCRSQKMKKFHESIKIRERIKLSYKDECRIMWIIRHVKHQDKIFIDCPDR